MLSVYPQMCVLPPEHSWPRGDTLKKKLTLPLPATIIASSSSGRGRAWCPPPLFMLVFDLIWTRMWFVHLSQLLWVHVYSCLSMSGGYCFLVFINHLWCLQCFLLLLNNDLWTLRAFDADGPFRIEHSLVSHSLYLSQLLVSLLITMYCK